MTKARRTKLWFSQAGVQGILGDGGDGEEGEGGEEEMERAVEVFKMKGGQLWEREGGEGETKNDVARELLRGGLWHCLGSHLNDFKSIILFESAVALFFNY